MKALLISLIILGSLSAHGQEEVDYNLSGKTSRNIEFAFASSLQIHMQFENYSQFNDILGSDNVRLMNNSIGTLRFGLTGFINNLVLGLSYGFSSNSNNESDSLSLYFNRFETGLNVGYKLIKSKRFIVVPRIALTWDHSRLTNSAKDSKIPLAKYISERNLDIRFNHLTASAGFNIDYIIYKKVPALGDYFMIGFYGGYITKINRKPWIYTVHNRLLTNQIVKINPLEIGISFSAYTF